MPGVGDKLGRYTLLKRLALGGMGEVFVAAKLGPVGFGPFVALKVLRDELAVDPQFIDMLVDEANISKHLDHRNLVSVLDLGNDDGSYFIAMEFVQGITAERLIESLVERRRRLDLPLALHVGIELCKGLRYAHTRANENGESLGIVHRDVTPANILISTEGEVKLTDFGIARAKGRIHQTQAGVLKGKFGYMAPEMVRYERIDARADVFCAGVVLYLLAAARHPVAHASVMDAIHRYEDKRIEPPSQHNPEIPPELDAVIMRALEPRPAERWPSAAALGEALQQILLGRPQWRASARSAASLLSHRVREVAPEVFGEVVPRDTLERLGADRGAALDRETDENLEVPEILRAPERSATFPDTSTDPGGSGLQDKTVPVPSVDAALLESIGRERSAPPEFDELQLDRTVADGDDGETVIGTSTAPGGPPGIGLSRSESTAEHDPPTVIPLGPLPRPDSGPDPWSAEADPAATLLDGLDVDAVRAAVARLPSTAVLDSTLVEEEPGAEPTFVRAVLDPAEAPRVERPLRVPIEAARAVGPADLSPAVAPTSADPEPVAESWMSAPKRVGVGTATGQWMAGRLSADQLEWGDDAAGRRAVATRDHPPQPVPPVRVLPPMPALVEPVLAPEPQEPKPRGVLEWVLPLAVTLALVGFGAWVWFGTQMLWPRLRLGSVPPGAEVRIDGRRQPGVTPLMVRVAPGQRHEVELRADGHRPVAHSIGDGIGRLRTYKLDVVLERERPVLHIGPVAGRVLLGGVEVGRGREVQLPELPGLGPIRLRVEAAGHRPYEIVFESSQKVPSSLDIPLEPSG